MAVGTPPSATRTHFDFGYYNAQLDSENTPTLVFFDVLQALQKGDIEGAQRVYDEAIEQGLFLAHIVPSYYAWEARDADIKLCSASIEKAIAEAIAKKALKELQAPSKLVNSTQKV